MKIEKLQLKPFDYDSKPFTGYMRNDVQQEVTINNLIENQNRLAKKLNEVIEVLNSLFTNHADEQSYGKTSIVTSNVHIDSIRMDG